CESCRRIMKAHLDEQRSLLLAVRNGSAQREALGQLEEFLMCKEPWTDGRRCGWTANQNRKQPREISEVLEKLPDWIKSAHHHFMRHVSFNRFPHSPRFFPRNLSRQESDELYTECYDGKLREAL